MSSVSTMTDHFTASLHQGVASILAHLTRRGYQVTRIMRVGNRVVVTSQRKGHRS